jgi:hypothetical protein
MRSLRALDDALAGARLLRTLPSLLRHPLTPERARAVVRRRLEQRQAAFLTIAREAVYRDSASPYLRMLQGIGCEYGDLERLVRSKGIEAALRTLFLQGVYVTVDEFKGRRPIVRGGVSIEADPSGFVNPSGETDVAAASSGSRGRRTATMLGLPFIRECAAATCLALEARGGLSWEKAIWETPAGGAVFRLLKYSSFGRPVSRWFSQVDPEKPRLARRYRWRISAVRAGSVLAGAPLPGPRYTPLDDPRDLVQWVRAVVARGGRPHLTTFASSAVRLSQAALEAGTDLGGAHLMLMGEPITAARVAAVRRAGATAIPRFGTIETGPIGYACLAPKAPDDVHLLHDLHALVQVEPGPGPNAGLPPGALLITSLSRSAPFVMMNVSMGDDAVIERRSCGCPMESHGWAIHLHTIRSFEKLTGTGTTFLDVDAIRVLEEALPARFGGMPTDYQLVEEEDADGRARLCLVVHPRLGPLGESEIIEAFLTGLAAGPRDIRAQLWREASLLRVERRPPVPTASGKILHLVGHRSLRLPS